MSTRKQPLKSRIFVLLGLGRHLPMKPLKIQRVKLHRRQWAEETLSLGELKIQLHNNANHFWESIPYQTGLLNVLNIKYILKLNNNTGRDLTGMCSISLEMQSRWEKQEGARRGAKAVAAKNNSGVAVSSLICWCVLHTKSLESSSSFLLVFFRLHKFYILQHSHLHKGLLSAPSFNSWRTVYLPHLESPVHEENKNPGLHSWLTPYPSL